MLYTAQQSCNRSAESKINYEENRIKNFKNLKQIRMTNLHIMTFLFFIYNIILF
jgi:hypothetical protein